MSELFPESHTGGESHAHGGKKGKILGMPPWALGVILAVGIIGFIYLRNRKSGTASSGVAPASAASGAAPLAYDDPNQVDPNSPTGETYAQEGYTTPAAVDSYLAGSGSPTTGPVGLAPQGLPPPSTNTQWASLVSDYLIGQGNDPTLVTNALSAFLSGQSLTQSQQAIVNTSLQQFGEPPQGLIPIATNNTNATPNPAPATAPTPVEGQPPHVIGAGPPVIGLTKSQAEAKINAAGFHVNNESGNLSGRVVSSTAYSDNSVNLGFA